MNQRQTKSAVEYSLPLPLTDFHILLAEIATGQKTTVDLNHLRKTARPLSVSQLWTRISLLLDLLRVSEDRGLDIAEAFASVLEQASDLSAIPRSEFEAVVRRVGDEDSGDQDVLIRYERKVLNLLRRSDTGWIAKPTNSVTPEPWIDPRPIIRGWPREILETAAWNRIESPVSGVQPLPIERTFVNLSLRELSGTAKKTMEELEIEALNELTFDRHGTGYALEDVLLGLRGMTVIMGLPGAGKSTLIKWIARYLVTSEDCPFGIPIAVNLRHFGREKAQEPSLTLLEHFFRSRGVTDTAQLARWRSLMAGLLDPADPSSDTTETFLWLLDGWDEVPHEMRDRILPEINSLSRYPGIITTRYSADPLNLPARRFFELRGLKFGAALDLVDRWLQHAGRGEFYGGIETLLVENPNLRRLSRNPFLLTLLCALYSDPGSVGSRPLPRTRGEILKRTLELVYAQHNADPKQAVKFHADDIERIKRFAYWLVSEAPNCPRFVFDNLDFEQCTGLVGSFESLLVPSRLVAVLSADRNDFQFIHANFQEQLAAQHLVANPKQIPSAANLAFDASWKEIIYFLAESAKPYTECWDVLWRKAREAGRLGDRFGIVASRLALWVAATGAEDGGEKLVGIDLRDVLWKIAVQHASEIPKPLIEALVLLDAQDFARRILDHRIKTGQNSHVTAWLEQLSIFDIEMLFTDHKRYERVLALPEVAVFFPELPDRVHKNEVVKDRPDDVLLRRIKGAAQSRRLKETMEGFWTAVDEGMYEVASEAIELLDHFPPDEIAPSLREIATAKGVDELTQGAAVRQLVLTGNKKEKQNLMLYLADLPKDSPSALAILGNLDGLNLDRYQRQVVEEFLFSSSDPETRMATAELLSTGRSRGTTAILVRALSSEADRGVRRTILRVLGEIAEEAEVETLWALKEGSALKSASEWGFWLGSFLATLQETRLRIDTTEESSSRVELRQQVRAWEEAISDLLEQSSGAKRQQLLLAVLRFPQVLGSKAMTELTRAIESARSSDETRVAAFIGLRKIGGPKAIEYLSAMAENSPSQELKVQACEMLGELSPEALARIGGEASERTMARLAFRREILFRNHSVVDVSHATAEAARRTKAASPPEWPIKADVGVFLALKEEFDSFCDLLRRRGGAVWEFFDDPYQAFTYFRAELKTRHMQKPVTIVAVCASQMGPTRAGVIASSFTTRCQTRSVVVIGIAGGFDGEIRLADVLVPSEVYLYLENTAATDAKGTWRLDPAGAHFTANAHLLNQTRQLGRKFPEMQKRWETRCRQRLARILGEEQLADALQKNLTRSKPVVFDGDHHLATGPAVGKSSAFSKFIQSHNRKAVAMEMETAAVFDAIETHIRTLRRLAIRGISDFADKRKTKVEKQYRGKFREVSRLNACDYFLTLIEAGVFNEPPVLNE